LGLAANFEDQNLGSPCLFPQRAMGRLGTSDYEDLRNARILENKARMASLGLHKTVSELRSITSSGKPAKPTTDIRKYCKKDYTITPLRRSGRLKQTTSTPHVRVRPNRISLRRSDRLRGKEGKVGGVSEESDEESEESSPHRPANKPLVKVGGLELQLSPEYSARRCDSKGRGSVYDPVFGICCHFCRFLFMPFHYHEMTILLLLSLSNLFCYLNCLLRHFIGS
jgi:hypothetical protein